MSVAQNADAGFMPGPDAGSYEIPQRQRNEDKLTGFNFPLKGALTRRPPACPWRSGAEPDAATNEMISS